MEIEASEVEVMRERERKGVGREFEGGRGGDVCRGDGKLSRYGVWRHPNPFKQRPQQPQRPWLSRSGG
jgi:hypothetical protein